MDVNQLGDDARRAIDDMLRDGRKIEAIKFVREETGAGLAETKRAVEDYARAHGFATGSSGCLVVLLVAGAGLLAALA